MNAQTLLRHIAYLNPDQMDCRVAVHNEESDTGYVLVNGFTITEDPVDEDSEIIVLELETD